MWKGRRPVAALLPGPVTALLPGPATQPLSEPSCGASAEPRRHAGWRALQGVAHVPPRHRPAGRATSKRVTPHVNVTRHLAGRCSCSVNIGELSRQPGETERRGRLGPSGRGRGVDPRTGGAGSSPDPGPEGRRARGTANHLLCGARRLSDGAEMSRLTFPFRKMRKPLPDVSVVMIFCIILVAPVTASLATRSSPEDGTGCGLGEVTSRGGRRQTGVVAHRKCLRQAGSFGGLQAESLSAGRIAVQSPPPGLSLLPALIPTCSGRAGVASEGSRW